VNSKLPRTRKKLSGREKQAGLKLFEGGELPAAKDGEIKRGKKRRMTNDKN
jgi:hypothetical protein